MGFSNEGTIQGTYRPLRNIIGMWIIQECRRDWIKNGINISWDDVVQAAQKAEPLRSIIDPDAPELYAGGNMEKKIQDFCRRTGQPVPETMGEIARCIYESLALRYRLALEGLDNRVEILWDDISLQDITQEAQAALYRAQAEKYRSDAENE